MMEIQYKRRDGTYVAIVNGLPYHVAPDDPLFKAAQEAGVDSPFEPEPEPIPEPTPEELRAAIPPLSFAQLLTGLVAMEWITEAEGLAWLKSEALPADIEMLIAGLPQEQQFATTARAMRMTVAERMDPLVDKLAAVRGFSPEQIDQFFLAFGDAAMQIEA